MNPIKFSEFFDFSDGSPLIQQAISDIKALKAAYEDFTKIVVGGQFQQLAQQQNELVASIKQLVDATKQLNITNKEAQNNLVQAGAQMAAYDAAMQKSIQTQQALKNIQNAAEASVNGLTATLNSQIEKYNQLDSAQAAERKQMSGLADAIRQTRQELKNLTDQTQIAAEKTKASADSINGLQTKLKELKDTYNNLSPSIDGKQMASYAEEIRKTEAAITSLNNATKQIKPITATPAGPAADSIDGLKLKLRGLEDEYGKLSQSTAGYDLKAKQLTADIVATKTEINTLTQATRANISMYSAAVGSYAALDIETKKLVTDLKNLESGMSGTNAKAEALKKQIAENTDKLKAFDKEIGNNTRNVGNYAAAFDGVGNSIQSLAAGYLTLIALLQEIKKAFDESLKFDSLQRTLEIVSGNTIEFAHNLQFLRDTAKTLGLSFDPLVTNFNKFYAAANEAGFSADKTRSLFESFARTFANLRLDPQRVSNGFLALEETISRGTVSSQQLRRQLSTEIPGAFEFAAKAVGVTTQELDKMLRKGQVLSEDFIPKFAKVLEEKFGNSGKAVDGLQSQVNKLSNTFNQAYQSEGLRNFFTSIISGVSSFVTAIGNSIGFLEKHQAVTVILAGAVALLNQSFIVAVGAKIADTVATVANTAAKVVGTAAIAALGVAQDIYAISTEAATGAITLATAAQRIWNLVISANPLGFFITLITATTAAVVALNENNKEAARIDAQKADLTRELVALYDSSSKAIEDINGSIKNFINLSVDERAALEKTIELKKEDLKTDLARLTAKRDNLIEDARAIRDRSRLPGGKPNISRVDVPSGKITTTDDVFTKDSTALANQYNGQIQAIQGNVTKLDEGLNTLNEVTHAYTNAMKVSVETTAGLEERQRLLNIAVKNTKKGTEEHTLALKALAATQKALKEDTDAYQIKQFNDADKIAKREESAAKKAEREREARIRKADELIKASAAVEVAEAENVYAHSKQQLADTITLEETKHDVIVKYSNLRLKLYDKDSKEYKTIQKEKEDADTKRIDNLRKAEEAIEKKIAATNKALLDQAKATIKASGEASDAERGRGANSQVNDIKLRSATGAITQMEAETELHNLKVSQLQEEISLQKEALDKITDHNDVYFDKKKALIEKEKALDDENASNAIRNAQNVAEQKARLEQAAFEFVSTLSNGLFEIQATNYENDIAALQKQHDYSISLAGSNATAKKQIDAKLARETAAIKRKEAESAKLGAIFNIGITTAEKVVSAYPNPYLMAAAAALGALEIGIVAAKPIPQYFRGRKNGPREVAELNERGAELIERSGKYYMFGGGQKTVGQLEAGDKVLTHEESVKKITEDYIRSADSDAFIDSILAGQKITLQSEERFNNRLINAVSQTSLSKETLTHSFKAAISDLPLETNVFDIGGHRRYLKKKNAIIEQVHERQTIGGNG